MRLTKEETKFVIDMLDTLSAQGIIKSEVQAKINNVTKKLKETNPAVVVEVGMDQAKGEIDFDVTLSKYGKSFCLTDSGVTTYSFVVKNVPPWNFEVIENNEEDYHPSVVKLNGLLPDLAEITQELCDDLKKDLKEMELQEEFEKEMDAVVAAMKMMKSKL